MNASKSHPAGAAGKLKKQFHPFCKFTPADCQGIILGTAPPARFCSTGKDGKTNVEPPDMNYYYGSKKNLFWDAMFCVFKPGKDIKEVRARKHGDPQKYLEDEVLRPNKLAIADILSVFYREGETAADNKLSDMEFSAIYKECVLERPEIKYIFCTSQKVKKLFLKILKNNGVSLVEQDGITHTFERDSKNDNTEDTSVKVITIPSPSHQAFQNNFTYNAWKISYNKKDKKVSRIEFLTEQYCTIFNDCGFIVHPFCLPTLDI